jgi:hypothetical protein
MAFNKTQHIEELLERYFEGLTSLEEEKQLQHYFLSDDVAPHLINYSSLFNYFASEKEIEITSKIPEAPSKKPLFTWVAVAAVFVLFAGMLFTWNQTSSQQDELGTFDDPEIAMVETLKALELVSRNVNLGMESVIYLNEYNQSKQLIFKTR